jgi:hypothetical protein
MAEHETGTEFFAGGDDELQGPALEEAISDFMKAVYVLIKSAFVYAVNNAALRAAAQRCAATANRLRAHCGGAAALQFFDDGAYFNRSLIKLDASSYDQSDYLFAVFSTLGLQELAAVGDTGADDWLEFVAVFKQCVGPGGDFRDFAKAQFANIRLVTIQSADRDNSIVVTDRFRALRAYAVTVISLSQLLEHTHAGKRLRPAQIKRPLQEITSLAYEHASLLLALVHLKRHKLSLQHHLANTAVISICAAIRLNLRRTELSELGVQAAMHDLGRAFVSGGTMVRGPAAERAIALQGVRRLVCAGSASPRVMARAVVANEVRRWVARAAEPAGDLPYPFDLAMSTRLIAVARAYDLLTTPTHDRPCLLADEALRVIMRDAGRRFDAAAVKLLVNVLGVYPVGSTVALSDGSAAVVIEAPSDPGGPTRPRIKLVRNAQGAILDGAVVDLAGDAGADLRIVRCIDAEQYDINPPAFLLS